jgi:hypothetical protein
MVTVCCVLWGDKFSEDYVRNLKAGVERNTTVRHKFVCLTDRHIDGVDTKFLKPGLTGWWNKLQLFDGDIYGRIVYLDLDTLIVNNIDWLLNYNGGFMGIEDLGAARQPLLRDRLQSGVMAWNSDSMDWVYKEFVFKKDTAVREFRGDGEYLNSVISNRNFLQRIYPNQLKSYKYDVYPENIGNVSIICFHGRPSIIQSMSESITTPVRTYEAQEWVKNYWRQ